MKVICESSLPVLILTLYWLEEWNYFLFLSPLRNCCFSEVNQIHLQHLTPLFPSHYISDLKAQHQQKIDADTAEADRADRSS